LVKSAVRLSRVLRGQDRLCRLGGDEFLLICPGLDQKAATLVADRVRTAMSAQFQIGDLGVTVGASVGVAVSAADSSVEELINAADSAMHVDKRGAARRTELDGAVSKRSGMTPRFDEFWGMLTLPPG
jgi:diguanylate cyclase (GGDEF)-like protein